MAMIHCVVDGQVIELDPATLERFVEWDDNDDAIVCKPGYKLNGVIVQQDCFALAKHPLNFAGTDLGLLNQPLAA